LENSAEQYFSFILHKFIGYLWKIVQNNISLLFCTDSSGYTDPMAKGGSVTDLQA